MNKRAFPRFRVIGIEGFDGRISSPPRDWKPLTFALGGCGFYSLELSPSAELNQRVYCEFAWSKLSEESVQVQGRLVNAVEVELDDKKVVYYGIEFVPAHRELVQPLIEELKKIMPPDDSDKAEDSSE